MHKNASCVCVIIASSSSIRWILDMSGGTGGGGGGGTGETGPPANFSAFNIMPMGGVWKESTSNGPRPTNRLVVAPSLILEQLMFRVIKSRRTYCELS